MTTIKRRFLMTASEMAMGRVMRAPDHDATTPVAPAATESGASDDDDFATFERKVSAPKAEPAAAAADDVTDPPEAGENGTGDDEPAPEGGEPAKKGKSVQERIDELTASRREAERAAEKAQRDAEYWRGKAEGAKPQEETPAAVVDDADGKPDPSKFEYGEADPDYIIALSEYGAKQAFAKMAAEQEASARVAEVQRKWQTTATSAAEKYPDFNEKVVQAANNAEWPCSPIVGDGILGSDVGADIAYHLASNLDEAKAIYAMNPLEQARAFGRLEARFMSEQAAAAPKPQPKLTTDAPKPPENRARGAGGKYSVDDDTTDFAAFEAKYSPRRH